MIKTSWLYLPLLILALAAPIAVSASAVKTGNAIKIAADETVDGSLYAAAATIDISGRVDGDVFCAGQSVTISGRVDGDVFCAGQSVTIRGQIEGSVRAIANSLLLDGAVGRDVSVLGNAVTLGTNGSVGRDFSGAGALLNILGGVGRDLYGASPASALGGRIGRNVSLRVDENTGGQGVLKILDGAEISGDFSYTANQNAEIADDAKIGGDINRTEPKRAPAGQPWAAARIWGGLFSVFSSLVVGLVLVSLWRGRIIDLTDRMLKQGGRAIGWGIVIAFITPFLVLALIFTLIGLPLALILFICWLVALYLSKIISAIAIGRGLLGKIRGNKNESLIWAMIGGVIILWLAGSIPFLGALISLATVLWGLGGLWLAFKKTN